MNRHRGPVGRVHATCLAHLHPVEADAAGARGAQVVPGHDRLHPLVPLADVGDAGGAVGVSSQTHLARIDQVPERVVGRVEPRLDAPVLLRRVTGSGAAARHRLIGMRRRREGKVDGVLGPVEEGAPIGLGREALGGVRGLAIGVGPPLALGVPGQDHVAVLGQRLRGVPVHLLVGLHRTVRDDDQRPLGRARLRRPHVAGDRRPVAGRVDHGVDHSIIQGPPVVEAGVARAAASLLPADIGGEGTLGVGLLDLLRGDQVLGAHLRQQGLILRRGVDRLALLKLGEVLGLDHRVELGQGCRGRHCRHGKDHQPTRPLRSQHAAQRHIPLPLLKSG